VEPRWLSRAFFAFAALSLLPVHSVRAQSPIEDLLKAQQTWHIKCMPKGCIASVDILRGESGDPPDPSDTNQYVSVAVAVNRSDRRPSLLMFEVDPNADQQAGIDLLFAHTVPDGKSWKVVVDPNGPMHLPFRHCSKTTCDFSIGGGTPDEATMKSCADLVARMQTEDHLFLTYTRGGHSYRTAVSLTLFKEAYARLLMQASMANESPSPDTP
jgi:hypothetical protein